MYLKSIQVHGFKSFADKIVFEFHDGITGIVGPNGSGKSNIADAVRWVLGEQSAKQLRGANMQDVIFSGTDNRRPLGYAYVAITIENSDHQLAVEYDEVTVARRVYRSGESEYLINGTNCRLKDIHELFYDTGIGKEGYSMIGQGQIDKILNGKPEERRELFDEATGIVKFKRRKSTAQKKLEDEKQNLVRIRDILSELEKQLLPLEKQSAAAKEYLKKREQLKEFDVNLFLMEIERIRLEQKQVDDKLSIVENGLLDTGRQGDKLKIRLEELEGAGKETDQTVEELNKALTGLGMNKGKLEGEINVLKEQIHSAQGNRTELQERIGQSLEAIKKKEAEKDSFLKETEELLEKTEELSKVRSKIKERLREVRSQIEEENKQIDDRKSSMIESLNKKANTKSKMGRYDSMLEQAKIRRSEINQKLLKRKSEEAEQAKTLENCQKELNLAASEIASCKEKISGREEKLEKEKQQLTDWNNEYEQRQLTYHKNRSRLDSLITLTERYDGYGISIKKVMECKKSYPGIIGVVADILKVDQQYETAVETALGGSIQNIVTKEEQTAKQMIEYLKKNKLGRATFLPLTSVNSRQAFQNKEALSEQGVIGLANELVKTEEVYEGLVNYLLGRTLVVDTIENGILLARKYRYTLRIVTLEGESLNPGGSMTGGSFKNAGNLLGRRREMEDLEKAVKADLLKIDHLLVKIEEVKKKIEKTEAEAGQLKNSLQTVYIRQNTWKINLDQEKAKRKESHMVYEELMSESKEIESQIEEIKTQEAGIASELAQSEEQERMLQEEVEQYQKALEEKQQEEARAGSELAKTEMEEAGLVQKREFLLQNSRRIQKELEEFKQNVEGMKSKTSDAALEIEKKEAEITELQKKTEMADKERELLEAQKKAAAEKKESISLEQKKYTVQKEELAEQIHLLDKESIRLRGQKEKLEEAMKNLNDYMWNEYELTWHHAAELKKKELTDLAGMKKQIAEIKEEIKKLGPVNVNAIEEYKSVTERYDFLNAQHQDLIEAENTLIGIIEELDAGMRAQFSEKFKEIETEFDKAFKELFGGGKGTLELMEEEDVLEAGIRIIAKPPGKKLQNMMQLSGGEKTLTAIALLFAIQNLKPSPFCLLDEIEAALDEANVDKFAKYLHKLTKNTQFIIITHRRGTMAAADRLYGITMQEKGVSALVSVNLIEKDLDQ